MSEIARQQTMEAAACAQRLWPPADYCYRTDLQVAPWLWVASHPLGWQATSDHYRPPDSSRQQGQDSQYDSIWCGPKQLSPSGEQPAGAESKAVCDTAAAS